MASSTNPVSPMRTTVERGASTIPALRIRFGVVAPFATLVRRGYLGLLAAGGPRVLAFGAAHGVRTLRQLRELVTRLRSREPAWWEDEGPGG